MRVCVRERERHEDWHRLKQRERGVILVSLRVRGKSKGGNKVRERKREQSQKV